MLSLILGKIRSNKWLVFCLLVGNILLVTTVSSVPAYSSAILQKVLIRQLEAQQSETGKYPGTVSMGLNTSSMTAQAKVEETLRLDAAIAGSMAEDFGVPIAAMTVTRTSNKFNLFPIIERKRSDSLALFQAAKGFESHAKIISGRMYSPGMTDNIIDVVVSEAAAVRLDLLLDEVYRTDIVKDREAEPYYVRIAGIFTNLEQDDLFWTVSPASMIQNLFMDPALFEDIFFTPERASAFGYASWEVSLDYHAFRADSIPAMLGAAESYKTLSLTNKFRYGDNFSAMLDGFGTKAYKLRLTLWVLQAPILILLAFFIYMVSQQILKLNKNEIAVIKSRGGTRPQVFTIYMGQSAFISAVSLAAGIPLSILMCNVLGASNGFLEMVRRSSLDVRLTGETLIYALLTSVFSVLTMIIPVIKSSRETIVTHKQSLARRRRPFWQTAFLDLLILGFSLYELYIFTNQKASLAQNIESGASADPMLFLSSSLFIFGAGLLFVRLFSLITRLIYLAGKNSWPPSLYASFMKVMRSSGEEQFIIIFLILTLSIGIFNARIARTINLNNEHSLRYQNGADLVLMEEWKINPKSSVSETDGMGNTIYKEIVYYEPDYKKYTSPDEAASVTRVFATNAGAVNGGVSNVRVLGIIPDEFGRTAWFRDGLLPGHINLYLNSLAVNPSTVIVSANFKTNLGYKIGDRITYTFDKRTLTGIITGFADYWPSYNPVRTARASDGTVKSEDAYLIVGSLSYMQSKAGIRPYEIWIKTNGSSRFVYDLAEQFGIKYVTFSDAGAELINAKNDPIFQGTNGALTVGFIMVIIVCMAGFLIYWILSIRSRELQFGIFRAMGLGMRSILSMLICEQALISGLAILCGAGIGILASELYVPLIQVGYSTGSMLPLFIASEGGDYLRIFAVTGFMLILCMFILRFIISKLKISQALKLGED